jgi:hypothetical protein
MMSIEFIRTASASGGVEKRADDIEREVSEILSVVAEFQAQVEVGREMIDRRFRLTSRACRCPLPRPGRPESGG